MIDGVVNICPACAPRFRDVRWMITSFHRVAVRSSLARFCLLNHKAWHRHIAPRRDDGWTIFRSPNGMPTGMGWRAPRPRVVGKTQWVSGRPIVGAR